MRGIHSLAFMFFITSACGIKRAPVENFPLEEFQFPPIAEESRVVTFFAVERLPVTKTYSGGIDVGEGFYCSAVVEPSWKLASFEGIDGAVNYVSIRCARGKKSDWNELATTIPRPDWDRYITSEQAQMVCRIVHLNAQDWAHRHHDIVCKEASSPSG